MIGMAKKRLLRGRDFAKELRVQQALARQIEMRHKLRMLQKKNRERIAELHPQAQTEMKRGVSALRKLSLEAVRETARGIREFKKLPRGRRFKTLIERAAKKKIR